ncbi:MAG: hypothetical protein ABSF24_01660 [Candidatus Bathyarchaeia archaeon]
MIDMPKLVEGLLKSCRVEEGEKVAIVSTHMFPESVVNAFMIALVNFNADSLRVILPPRIKEGKAISPVGPFAAESLKMADMIITVYPEPVPGHLYEAPVPRVDMYSDYFVNWLKSGARILDVMLRIPEANLRRLYPTDALIRRSLAGAEMMEKAEKIRITSGAGTDLVLNKKGRKGACQKGVASERGSWDNYGFGLVICAPLEDSANGTLVFDTGDYILGIGRIVTEPVKCTLKNGSITKIEGGSTAKIFEKWLATRGDERSYGVSHIGWGTHVEGAVWLESPFFSVADAESYPGVMQIAFGSNFFDTLARHSGIGGKNRAPSHCDVDLLNHDFYLDDELIVKEGKIVHPKCK